MTEEAKRRFRQDDIDKLKEIGRIAGKQGYIVVDTIYKAINAMKMTSPCELCKFDPSSNMDNNPCLKCPAEAR